VAALLLARAQQVRFVTFSPWFTATSSELELGQGGFRQQCRDARTQLRDEAAWQKVIKSGDPERVAEAAFNLGFLLERAGSRPREPVPPTRRPSMPVILTIHLRRHSISA
jgi:hypothetical protein